jgi:hypothetical protein
MFRLLSCRRPPSAATNREILFLDEPLEFHRIIRRRSRHSQPDLPVLLSDDVPTLLLRLIFTEFRLQAQNDLSSSQDGEIMVPAGAKAVGHIRNGDRSGYVNIQFDSLLMPDGVIPIEAAATGLELRPLKGKVEGKNTGKNILVRSLSGIGQAGAMLV